MAHGDDATDAKKEKTCLAQARQIATACKLYATDHDGHYPNDVNALFPDYLKDKSVLVCPFSDGTDPIGYECFGGHDMEALDIVLLRSRFTTRDGRRTIIYSDVTWELKEDRTASAERKAIASRALAIARETEQKTIKDNAFELKMVDKTGKRASKK